MTTQVTVTTLAEGATTTDLVNALLGGGSGVTVSNVTYSGNIAAAGTFTGVGSGIFNSGIILSSGNANDAELSAGNLPDTSFGTSSGSLKDPVSLGFDIVATGSQIVFNYRFATGEGFGSSFNDPFTLTLDGTNIALLPNGNPVSVGNISYGNGYAINNYSGQFGAPYDGFSIALTATATVTPGQTYHLTFNVADGGDDAVDSAAFIQGGSLRVNSAPTLSTQIANQGATAGAAFSYVVPGGSFTDADTGDTLAYSAKQTSGSALPAWLSFNASTQTFSGTPPAGTASTVSVRVTATDGGGLTVTDDFDIAVALPVNHAPVFTGTAVGATLTQAASVALAGGVVVSDIDAATFDGGSLTVGVTTGFHAGDVVAIAQTGGIALSGGTVSYNNVAIGTLAGGNGTALVVTLATGVGAAAVTALTQAITLSNATDAVSNDTRTVTFALNDGGGTANGGHDTTSFQVTVAASDPAPSVVGVIAAPGTGIHGLGATVLFTVAASEAVTVSGTPTLLLSDGGTATYVSGSGTNALVFSHTITAGNNAADLAVTGFALNGGTIRDGAGQDLAALPSGGIDPAGTLVIDTAAPGAPVVSLVHDTGASGSDLVTSDAHVSVATAEIGGTLAYSVDGGAYGATYDPSSLSDGKHTVSVTQTDAVGNVSIVGSTTFVLDSVAPGLPVVSLAKDTGTSGSDFVTSDAHVSVASAEIGGTLAYSVDGGAYGASYDPSSLSQGKHTISVTQTDAAGNVSVAGSTTFVLDSLAPAVPVLTLTHDTGASASDFVTSDAHVSVASVEIGGTLAYSVDGGASGATYDPSVLAQGKHTVSVTQTDAAGNVSVAGSTTFVLDSLAPAVPVLTLTHDTGASASDLVTSDGHVSVASAEVGGTLAYSVDGGAYGATYDPSSLSQGKHTVSVTQTDAAGNVSAAGSIGFTLMSTAPSVTISGMSGASNVVDHVVSGTVDLAQAGTLVTVADAGTVIGTATVQADGTWALPVLFSGDGATHVYHLTATDTDLAGNTGSASFSFGLDFTGNTALFGSVQQAQPHGAVADLTALYDAIFDRAPDARGWEGWVPALDRGVSVHDLAVSLLSSAEFTAQFGVYTAGSDTAFVNHLYETALHREADVGGLSYWTAALSAGNVSRADVAVAIAFSSENAQGLGNAGGYVPDSTSSDVARLYYELLARSPDAAGLSDLSARVHGGASLVTIAQTLVSSAEFSTAHPTPQTDAAFIEGLYQNALGRSAETAGADGWLDALAHGTSRAEIAVDIAGSVEAMGHLAARIEAGWHLHG